MKHFNHSRQQRPKKNLLITGKQNVLQALEDGTEIERIYILNQGNYESIRQAAALKDVPVQKVPIEKLKSFNAEGHEGCIALKSKIHYQDLQNVISWVVEKGEAPLILILDGITDIRNIGAIARTAYCCGVHAMVIPHKGIGTLNEDAIHASAGALEHLTVCRVKTLEEAIDLCKLNGIQIMASEMTGKSSLYDLDMRFPLAIIMGSEDEGIRPALYKKSDFIFQIPMKNNFESLNVSAATAMILYEVMRQRTA